MVPRAGAAAADRSAAGHVGSVARQRRRTSAWRGRRRAGAMGRGRPGGSPAVRDTGGSSAASKRSTAALGYVEDRFVQQLVPRSGGGGGGGGRRPRRRAPAIHRGYYVRARAVEFCARAFLLRTGAPCSSRRQILSVGAGFDSLYFRLKSQGLLGPAALFVEVDFPEVAREKADLLRRTDELAAWAGSRGASPPAASGAVEFSGEDYKLLGVDLSELSRLEEALQGAGLDSRVPTMILAEVVLTYMEVERSDVLVQWAAGHFLQAWFILYEQIHPDDPFGRVMRSHFSQLKSPLCSLVHYPDCKSQQVRFLERGWSDCTVIDMNEFYSRLVPQKEQQRIQALEPFDEFEEWHLKCSHYFILVASKGETMSPALVFSGREALPICREPDFAGTISSSVCATDVGIAGLRRYGHRSVLLAPDMVLTTGGFGDHGGHHCRLTELHVLIKHEGAWRTSNVCLAKSGEAWDGRLFHSLTLLQAGWAVVLGGRKSPLSPALMACRLRMSGTAESPVLELTHLPSLKELAVPRWRHSATEIAYEGEMYLFVYGGCSSGQSVLADWHFLHLEEFSCRQIPVKGPVPLGRHSHTACDWSGGVLIAGGLGAMEKPLGSILFLRPTDCGFRWDSIETFPPLTPRYSHTAHVHCGKLLLVGGVWSHATSVPGVAVIDLMSGLVAEYHIDTAPIEWPLMLHNHSSIFLPDEEMLLLGGGGNCFSFGSHLNQHPVRLALRNIWRVP
ncbi:tRNA wybutosine-synthesizing protein 4-like [Pogona vitticeps]